MVTSPIWHLHLQSVFALHWVQAHSVIASSQLERLTGHQGTSEQPLWSLVPLTRLSLYVSFICSLPPASFCFPPPLSCFPVTLHRYDCTTGSSTYKVLKRKRPKSNWPSPAEMTLGNKLNHKMGLIKYSYRTGTRILIQLDHMCVVPIVTFVTVSRNKTIYGRMNGKGTSTVQTTGCGVFRKGEVTGVWGSLGCLQGPRNVSPGCKGWQVLGSRWEREGAM